MPVANIGAIVALREYMGRTLPADSIRGRLARGSIWSFTASMFSRVFGMVAVVIVVRLLGRETYGEFSMIQRTVSMFGLFGSLGLGVTATKFVSESYRTDPKKAGRVFGLVLFCVGITSTLVCAILLVLAPWLAETVLNRPSLGPMLRIGCLVLLLSKTLQASSFGKALFMFWQLGLWCGSGEFKELLYGWWSTPWR
jgi:O-antigen/teichoic acid export membrane protein